MIPVGDTPSFIESVADFTRVVVMGETRESATLDFKSSYGERRSKDEAVRREAALELCRDIAQFANAWGGCLVIGVAEEKSVAASVHPVADDLAQWVGQAIRQHLVPATMPLFIQPLETSDGRVLAVNIPPFRGLAAVCNSTPKQTRQGEKHTIEYVRRMGDHKVHMNAEQAFTATLDRSRASRISFNEAIAHMASREPTVELIPGLRYTTSAAEVLAQRQALDPFERAPHVTCNLHMTNVQGIELRVYVPWISGTPTLVVPWGLVEEAWKTATGMGLVLSVAVCIDVATARLER